MIDSTGVGDPIVERLQRGGHGHYQGFHFSLRTKQRLMDGLAAAIQQRLVAFPPGVLVAELEAFEYRYSRTGVQYAAPDGEHGDCVCALALAVMKYTRRFGSELSLITPGYATEDDAAERQRQADA